MTDALVPPAARAALDLAKAANARGEAGDASAYAEADAAIDRACDLVGIPRQNADRSLPLVALSSLSDVQRATLAYAAKNDIGVGPSFRVPAFPGELYQWLEIEGPSLLDTLEVDLGHEGRLPLRRALAIDAGRALDALPSDVALRVIHDHAHDFDLGRHLAGAFQTGECRACRELRDEARAWALERVSAIVRSPDATAGSVGDAVVLFAFARAGVPLQRAWSTLGRAVDHVPLSELAPLIAAIPAADRAEWLAPAARAGRWASRMLALAPSVALAEAQLAGVEPYSALWRSKVEQIAEVGASHAELAALAARLTAEMPALPQLVVTRVVAPTSADELTPLEREQLRVATRGYDELDLDATARLADDRSESSMHGDVEVRAIASASGAPLYDAVLFRDEGVFFRVGTTEAIGWVSQGGVVLQEKNDLLRQALAGALGASAAKAAKKKTPTKKTPTKKTPTKKTQRR